MPDGAKPNAPFADPVKAALPEPAETFMQKFQKESNGPLDHKLSLPLLSFFRTDVRTARQILGK
jgi:hypothetical protein